MRAAQAMLCTSGQRLHAPDRREPGLAQDTMNKTARLIVNFVAFQLGWFACVLGAASDWVAAGTAAALLIVGLHVALAARPTGELALVLVVSLIGGAWDSLLAWLRPAFTTRSGLVAPGLAPYWLVAMWALFATALNISLRWLRGRFVLAAVLGAIGGPVAYLSGQRLGALAFPDLRLGLLAEGIGWAALMPLLLILAARFDGIGPLTASRGTDRV